MFIHSLLFVALVEFTSKFLVKVSLSGYISSTSHQQKAFIFGPWVPKRVCFHAMSIGPRFHAPGWGWRSKSRTPLNVYFYKFVLKITYAASLSDMAQPCDIDLWIMKWRSAWPIFHGSVILPYILTIWCMIMIVLDNGSVGGSFCKKFVKILNFGTGRHEQIVQTQMRLLLIRMQFCMLKPPNSNFRIITALNI